MRINGVELAVEIDGHGPAVLLVHGIGATSNAYQVQTDALADRFQVIRVDAAGAGRSGLRDGMSIDTHADDLAAVLDGLGIDSVAAVGHSMGTLIVRALMTRHPGRVSALALLGAIDAPADAGRRAWRERAAAVRENGTVAVAPAIVANALSETTRRDRPEIAAFVRELIMRQDPEGYARNCEAVAAATDPGPIPADVPLLLATGADDKVGPPSVSAKLAAAHGDAAVEVLPGTGHWTTLEAARESTALLTKFLIANSRSL